MDVDTHELRLFSVPTISAFLARGCLLAAADSARRHRDELPNVLDNRRSCPAECFRAATAQDQNRASGRAF
jgi:hypothetical protein